MSLFKHVPADESRAIAFSLMAGVGLTILKFVAYFITGSSTVFTDAMESIVNIAAAIFAAYSLSMAHRPADADHPYGHGKIEFLSAGFEGGMVLLASVVATVKAIDSILHGGSDLHSDQLPLGAILIAIALAANGCLGIYLVRSGRRSGSLTLEADGHHLLSDAWTSLAALIAMVVLIFTRWRWVDPAAAIVVAVYIAIVGLRLMSRAAAGLMDRQDESDQRLLKRILDAHVGVGAREPVICNYHKVRHRHSGRYHWVDFHVVVPSAWDVDTGHRVASKIEKEIEKALGEGNATAHVEPCIRADCPRCHPTLEGAPQPAAGDRAGAVPAP